MKILLSFLILISLSGGVNSETFRISTGEFVPYCSSAAFHKGFASHVVEEAFARQGHKVEFDFLPWKRAMLEAKLGRYDATSWWVHSDERDTDFFLSDEILERTIAFLYHKYKNSEFDWKEMSDLSGMSIGVTRGYHYTDKLVAFRKTNKALFEEVNTDEQNIKRLLLGRIDIFPMNTVTGMELLHTKFAPHVAHQLNFHPRALNTTSGLVMFPKVNKRSEQIRDILNTGLKSIREDGTYEKLLDGLLKGVYSK